MIENFNSADEAQVKKAEKTDKFKIDRDKEDLKYLLSLPQFRRFAWKLIGHCKVLESTFDTNNAVQSFLNGRRDVGTFLLAEIDLADQDAYTKMKKEGNLNAR